MKTHTESGMKKTMTVVTAAGIMLGALASGPFENAVLHGETDKARAIDYAPGEEMVFTLSLQGAEPFDTGEYFVKWMRSGDDGLAETGRVDATTLPLVVKTKIDRPGFVRIFAEVENKNGEPYKKTPVFTGNIRTPEGKKAMNRFERQDKRVFFDGGAGVKVDTLQSVDEPKDFDAFWAKRRLRLARVPMTVTVKEHKSKMSAVKVQTFTVPCAGPRPVTGCVTVPTDRSKKYPAAIHFHGYGAHFIQSIPDTGPTNRLEMFINAHGYELEREEEYYTEFYNSIRSNGKSFGLDSEWQNKSADTAYFGWMIYRIMRAIEYLKSFPEWDGKNLCAEGGSMGGLQTMWAAGIDPDVSIAKLSIPWCCDIGGRQTLKRLCPTWSVEETEALRYFDPVNFAKRVSPRCRVEITRAGLGDYTCPPSGICILYNNLKCPKRINWIQGSTHGYVPPEPHQQFTLSECWD